MPLQQLHLANDWVEEPPPPATKKTPAEPKLIDIKQFAQMAGLSVRTLERLQAKGTLPRLVPIPGGDGKPLRAKRWSRRSVVEWIQRNASRVGVAV